MAALLANTGGMSESQSCDVILWMCCFKFCCPDEFYHPLVPQFPIFRVIWKWFVQFPNVECTNLFLVQTVLCRLSVLLSLFDLRCAVVRVNGNSAGWCKTLSQSLLTLVHMSGLWTDYLHIGLPRYQICLISKNSYITLTFDRFLAFVNAK